MPVQGSNLTVMVHATGVAPGPEDDARQGPAAPVHAVDAASGVAACGERPLVVFEDLAWPPPDEQRCPRCVRELGGGLARY